MKPVLDSGTDRTGVDEFEVFFWEALILSRVVDFEHYSWGS